MMAVTQELILQVGYNFLGRKGGREFLVGENHERRHETRMKCSSWKVLVVFWIRYLENHPDKSIWRGR